MRAGRHLSYANVMATLAFFVAIGGTTYAAVKIDGGDIEPGTVKGKALKTRSVPGSKLKPNSVRGAQVRESSLGTVPSAERAGLAVAAGDSATLNGLGAAALTDDCPGGAQLYAGSCIESVARSADTWPDAAEACGDLGRRLPTLDELEGFRQEPGVTLASPEHVSTFFATEPGSFFPNFWTASLYDDGSIGTNNPYGTTNAGFRCVAPLTNR